MKINITNERLPLEGLKSILDSTDNIKDLHLLCHQAGCPVYIIRNLEGLCDILWHPNIEKEEGMAQIKVVGKRFTTVYKGAEMVMNDIAEFRRSIILNNMLGDNPFDDNYCVWKR